MRSAMRHPASASAKATADHRSLWRRWLAGLLAVASITIGAQSPRKVTIDDLMALRTINDVKISPAGDQIAYTVSTPSVERNAHEPALFVIPATGGTPKRLAENYRVFTPAPEAPE
jgi:hypothetical protein